MRQVHAKVYICALAVFAAMLAASWTYWYGFILEPRFILGALVFAGFILLGDLVSVRITEHTTIGAWGTALTLAVVTLGPTWAALAALPAALYVGRRDLLRTIYEIGHSFTIAYLAGVTFSIASDPLLNVDSTDFATTLYATLVSGTVLIVSSEVVGGILLKLKYNQPFRKAWSDTIQPYLLSDTIDILTSGFGALAFVVYGPVAAIVVVAGSIGSQVLVCRSREQVKVIRKLRDRVESLEEALATTNTTFGTLIVRDMGRRDGYTHRHAIATAVYAADLARELKMDEVRVGRLRMAGLLHNIGLFSLPEDLLLATGKLNSIAQSQLAEHPVKGEQALAAVPEFREMASWVRWHHERIDGRGYPDKLRGAWIPLEAKILAVAQAYAAMVIDQPRRPGMGVAKAREQLVSGIDKEFDGMVVRALLRNLDTETEGYRLADDYRFVFPTPDTKGTGSPSAREGAVDGTGITTLRELSQPRP